VKIDGTDPASVSSVTNDYTTSQEHPSVCRVKEVDDSALTMDDGF